MFFFLLILFHHECIEFPHIYNGDQNDTSKKTIRKRRRKSTNVWKWHLTRNNLRNINQNTNSESSVYHDEYYGRKESKKHLNNLTKKRKA